MQLYFLRHGLAEDAGINVSDHDRPLTPMGRRRLQTAAQVIATLDLQLAYIFSSPRLRATQTAEIIADALKHPVEIREDVNFGFNVLAVKKLTDKLSPNTHVMFVGHEPSFSATIHALTGADVNMKKGSLARIDLLSRTTPIKGRLVWLIAPRVFDALHGLTPIPDDD